MLLKGMCNNISIEKKLLQDPHGNSHQLILEKSRPKGSQATLRKVKNIRKGSKVHH